MLRHDVDISKPAPMKGFGEVYPMEEQKHLLK